MNVIKWVHSPTCIDCIAEIEGASPAGLRRIVQERKRRRKCVGCERLRNVVKGLGDG